MKKTALSILAAVLMVIGLAGAPSQAAVSAAAGPYTGTVGTKVTITAVRSPFPSGATTIPMVRAKVTPTSGTAVARGTVVVICRTIYKGKLARRVGPVQAYVGPLSRRLNGPKLIAKQTWNCYVRFDGGESVFKGSQAGPVAVRVV